MTNKNLLYHGHTCSDAHDTPQDITQLVSFLEGAGVTILRIDESGSFCGGGTGACGGLCGGATGAFLSGATGAFLGAGGHCGGTTGAFHAGGLCGGAAGVGNCV